jgi:hypothetical protein
MSGRVVRAAGVALGSTVLLVACSSGGTDNRPPAPTTDSALATSDPPPVGSIDHPRPVACVSSEAHSEESPTAAGTATGSPSRPPSRLPTGAAAPTRTTAGAPGSAPTRRAPAAGEDDVTVGPVVWPGLRLMADGDQNAFGSRNSDGWHYKVAIRLRAGTTVTVTIGAQERAQAALEYGQGFGYAPAPAVTFQACPGSVTGFPGGFLVAGVGRACVPVEVRVGDGAPQRVVISFFNGQCPA